MSDVLTPDEVAAFLRTAPANVQHLLEEGTLVGFKVGGEWRVLDVALTDFLRRSMEASKQEALSRAILDPRTWAREARRDPWHMKYLGEHDFEEGTFGAWIKDALQAEEQEDAASNIVRLVPKRD